MKIVFDIFKKWGLALLFLLLGVTWIFINPLIELGCNVEKPWGMITGVKWVSSFIYLAFGVALLLRTFKPSIKIPEIVYTLAFCVLAAFALSDFFELFRTFSSIGDIFDYLPGELKVAIVLQWFIKIFYFLSLACVVVLMLNKQKYKKWFFVPSAVMGVAVLFQMIQTIIVAANMPASENAGIVTLLIFDIILAAAIFFFAYFFVAENNAEGEVDQETENQTDISFAEENEGATETAATETVSQPKLSAAQQAELDNAKELFELGAYSEEEFEEEKKRIMLGL